MNLDRAVRILRELDASGQADGLIATYIEVNKNRKEEFNLDNYAFSDQVQDEKLRQAFTHAFRPTQEKKDFREVLARIADRQSWSKSDTEFLASTTVTLNQTLY